MSVHLTLLGLLRDLDETGFDFNPEVRFDRFCEELEETFGIGRGKIQHVYMGSGSVHLRR
jgi:hypothetical protein